MRIMNARNFRREFPTLSQPVMVISREKLLGTWTPDPDDPEVIVTQANKLADAYASINSRPFTPVPKTKGK